MYFLRILHLRTTQFHSGPVAQQLLLGHEEGQPEPCADEDGELGGEGVAAGDGEGEVVSGRWDALLGHGGRGAEGPGQAGHAAERGGGGQHGGETVPLVDGFFSQL